MNKKLLASKVFWLLVTLVGLCLALLELGMAISESHALKGTNILFFVILEVVGLFFFILGISKLLKKSRGKGSE